MNNEELDILLADIAFDAAGADDRAALRAALAESPEHDRRHGRFLETLAVLERVPATQLVIPQLEQEDELDELSARRRRSRRTYLMAAAALITATVGVWIWLVSSITSVGPATITHVDGNCYSGARLLQAGRQLSGHSLRSGEGSTCDVRLNLDGGTGGTVLVRLHEQSAVEFSVHSDGTHLSLKSGEILIDADRQVPQHRLTVHSSGHLVEVLGTQLAVHRRDASVFRTEVVDGTIRVRSAHYLAIDGLQRGIHPEHQERLARELPQLFQEREHIVEAGRHLRVEYGDDYHDEAPELFRKLHAEVEAAKAGAPEVSVVHGHRIDSDLQSRLRAVFEDHPHLHRHFNEPPAGDVNGLDDDRQRALQKAFEHAREKAAGQ